MGTWEILEDFSKKKQEWLLSSHSEKKGVLLASAIFRWREKFLKTPACSVAARQHCVLTLKTSAQMKGKVEPYLTKTSPNYSDFICQSELEWSEASREGERCAAASEEICFQVWLQQHAFTSGLLPFTGKSSFWTPDPQTQENPLTCVKIQPQAAGQHVGAGAAPACRSASRSGQQSKHHNRARKISAWRSAISDTWRTGNASEHRIWGGDGGGHQLPPTLWTAWTPFTLHSSTH